MLLQSGPNLFIFLFDSFPSLFRFSKPVKVIQRLLPLLLSLASSSALSFTQRGGTRPCKEDIKIRGIGHAVLWKHLALLFNWTSFKDHFDFLRWNTNSQLAYTKLGIFFWELMLNWEWISVRWLINSEWFELKAKLRMDLAERNDKLGINLVKINDKLGMVWRWTLNWEWFGDE